MSRSRKKEAVYKDQNNGEGKKTANRILRRKVKQAIQNEDDTMPLLDEVYNKYNIVDFKIRGKKFKDEEYYEKLKRK